MNHFYRNVPKLGHVAVSRHAQKRMEEDNIYPEMFERVLLTPVKPDVREGADILWRERDGIRMESGLLATAPRSMTSAPASSRLSACDMVACWSRKRPHGQSVAGTLRLDHKPRAAGNS